MTIEKEIQRRKWRIEALRDRMDSVQRRSRGRTTDKGDSIADFVAAIVDLEREVEQLENDRCTVG